MVLIGERGLVIESRKKCEDLQIVEVERGCLR